MSRDAAAKIPAAAPPCQSVIVRTTILKLIPTAPMSMSGQCPILSIVKTGINEARKYSVPLQAARIRARKPLSPIWFS